MSFFSIIESLFIGPLKLVFEIIYEYAYRLTNERAGLAIIGLSLVMNILVLPLYRRADAMQAKARDTESRLRDGVSHIKKTFSGNERMMILQTYYRQNNYKPTDSLKGSVSLLLEIPFFMAAYQFLSTLEILIGESFGPIPDLAAPDGLFVIGGGQTVNVFPIIMTIVNCCSGALYLKGFPLKDKLQVYGMALIFLIILYPSPSGLVFYWTLNNVFSLVKNIFYKLKDPKKVLRNFAALCGLLLVFCGALIFDNLSIKRRVFIILVGLMVLLPYCCHYFLYWLRNHGNHVLKIKKPVPDRKMFLAGSVFLAVFLGVLIPSAYIAASPQEYLEAKYFYNPVWYIVNSFCLASGFFLVWLQVFYWLATPVWKVVFDRLAVIGSGVALADYMFFGRNLGNLSNTLQYDSGVSFSLSEKFANLAAIFLIAIGLSFFLKKQRRMITGMLAVMALAVGCMSAFNIIMSQKSVTKASAVFQANDKTPQFSLSKTGKNVVVLILDRGMGEYIPYLFHEKPELKEKFSGFMYYGNVISHGGSTIFGMPAVFGGYEYTPVEMNKRNSEKLVDKHNEALKVLPVIFNESGYDVTVCDPTYANYQWTPDLSIYDEYQQINKFITKGKFSDAKSIQTRIEGRLSNFFCFSVMKSMPVFLQKIIYDDGYYGHGRCTGSSQSVFADNYRVLCNLPDMTNITSKNNNSFMIMVNDTTHDPTVLQKPEYVSADNVDNSGYDKENPVNLAVDGRQLRVDTHTQTAHYHTNMAAMIQLGKWFDYLRENDIYDNTRIILTSDHGRNLGQLDSLIMDDGAGSSVDVESYFPLLMVKDFNSKGFTSSDAFMTNADVPTLALQGLIENPKNPFTGKPVNNDEKYTHDQIIIMSEAWDISKNNGNTFLPARWASVKDDIWDEKNWNFTGDEKVLYEYRLP